MTELQRIGFFREMPHGQPTDPSLGEARGASAAPHEERIAAYLEAGHVLIATPSYTHDVFDPDKRIGPPHYCTDGRFVWPGDLAHYVRTYHVRLDGRFLQHVLANDWTVPRDVDLTSVALPKRSRTPSPPPPSAPSSSPELAVAEFAATERDASLLTQITQLRDVPVPVLVQAIATATATAEGLEGVALRQQIADLSGQLQTVLRGFQIKAAELRQRSRTSADADRLLDAIARTDTAAGRAIAAHRADIIALFAELDLSQLSRSLQLLVAWLSDPANANPASMQQLLARLQSATAAPAGNGDKPH